MVVVRAGAKIALIGANIIDVVKAVHGVNLMCSEL